MKFFVNQDVRNIDDLDMSLFGVGSRLLNELIFTLMINILNKMQ